LERYGYRRTYASARAKLRKPYARRRRQLLDGWRTRRGRPGNAASISPALELLDRRFSLQRQQLGAALVRSIGAEHRGGESASAAPPEPDRHATSLQGTDVVDGLAPVEYPERDIGDASERLDPRCLFASVGAALHESDVHAAVRLGEELDVGQGSGRLPHLQGDPVPLEDLLVAARVVLGATFIGRNCRGEPLRRRGLTKSMVTRTPPR